MGGCSDEFFRGEIKKAVSDKSVVPLILLQRIKIEKLQYDFEHQKDIVDIYRLRFFL